MLSRCFTLNLIGHSSTTINDARTKRVLIYILQDATTWVGDC